MGGICQNLSLILLEFLLLDCKFLSFCTFFQIIAYDRRRGGTIVIDKRPTETVTSLIISQADESDSGRYTCDPASSYPQSIQVHVTKGKNASFHIDPHKCFHPSVPMYLYLTILGVKILMSICVNLQVHLLCIRFVIRCL